jgi:cytochrome c oxidase subunit IV
MTKDIKTQKRISYLLLTCAIFLASVVGFFSVKGLAQVFAGAGMAIILLGAGIEISKLVIASFLHRYWHKLTLGYKVGGLIFLFLVIFVTSSGVYGILSQAYTENKNKLMASKSEVALVEEKKKFFIDKKNDLQSEYKQIISDIAQTRLQRNTTSSGMMSDSKDVYVDSRGRTSSKSNASTRKDYLQQVEGLNSDIGKMESRNRLVL